MELNLTLLARMVGRLRPQARILTATSGPEAIQLCREMRINCIFMDIHMPLMSGIEACQAVRNLSRHYLRLVIVALSATSMSEAAIAEAGFSRLLLKPVLADEIELVIAHAERRQREEPSNGGGRD